MYGKYLQVVELIICHPIKWLLGLHELAVCRLVVAKRSHGDRSEGWGDEILTLSWPHLTLTILYLE